MHQNPEIYFVTIIGIILGLILVGFIVTILFLYQRRQHRQEQREVEPASQVGGVATSAIETRTAQANRPAHHGTVGASSSSPAACRNAVSASTASETADWSLVSACAGRFTAPTKRNANAPT